MTYDYAIHSDYLIHWTGKDIDAKSDPDWYTKPHSRTSEETKALYLERLQNILSLGLWMTKEPSCTLSSGVTMPATPVCCFTELKLSLSRRHARQYGRLGVGVKRPFLFERLGRPICYYGYRESSSDPLLQACARDLKDKTLLQFFKPMNSTQALDYDLYAESEWRIIYQEELLRQRKIIDPRDPKNVPEHRYFQSLSGDLQDKLMYLIPLDGWFQMIIFPSIDAKNDARNRVSYSIVNEIERIKALPDHGNRVEKGNWPVEVNLDACRNF